MRLVTKQMITRFLIRTEILAPPHAENLPIMDKQEGRTEGKKLGNNMVLKDVDIRTIENNKERLEYNVDCG